MFRCANQLLGIIFACNKAKCFPTHCKLGLVHVEKFFRNVIKLTRYQIVFTIFRLIWNHLCVYLTVNRTDTKDLESSLWRIYIYIYIFETLCGKICGLYTPYLITINILNYYSIREVVWLEFLGLIQAALF